MGRSQKKRKPQRSLFWQINVLLIVAALSFGGNLIYQVYLDPLEALRILPVTGPKTLHQTWNSYSSDFEKYRTPLVPARLLAAIAQAESAGDAWAQPGWEFKFSNHLARIYAPLSSAFGLMQITGPTMRQIIRLCKTGAATEKNHKEFCNKHWHTRLMPSSSIAMTSFFLDHQLKRLTRRHGSLKPQDRIKLAAVIHLCGAGVANRLVKAKMSLKKIGKCGTHSPKKYVHRVLYYFRSLRT